MKWPKKVKSRRKIKKGNGFYFYPRHSELTVASPVRQIKEMDVWEPQRQNRKWQIHQCSDEEARQTV